MFGTDSFAPEGVKSSISSSLIGNIFMRTIFIDHQYINSSSYSVTGHEGHGVVRFGELEGDDEEDIDTIDADDIRQLNDLLK